MTNSPSGATPSQVRALRIAIVFMMLVALGMAWLVARGIMTGVTFLPAKRTTFQRVISQANDPAMFWVSIGLYALVGIGALALGVWGLREGARLRARGS